MSSSKSNQTGIPNRRPLAPGTGEASNNSRRRTPRTHEQDQPPTSMPPAGLDPTRGFLSRQESGTMSPYQSQRPDNERVPSPRPTRTDTAPPSVPPPPPQQRMGHRYGSISLGGNAKGLVGNAYDPETMSPDNMPLHEYGQIQGGDNAKFIFGDTTLQGAGMFLGFGVGQPGAPPRSNTT